MRFVEVMVPERLKGDSMSQVVHDALGSLGGPIPAEVALNFGNLIFVEPSGIVFLSNFIHWLHVQKSTARFIGVNKETEALRFLDDSLFFEQHWKKN